MHDLIIDFRWYKDPKGYRLIKGKNPRPRKGQSIDDFLSNVRLGDAQPARVVRNGGKLQPYNPLRIPNLFERFINAAKSPEDVLDFIKRYGPLTPQGLLSREQVEKRRKDEEKDIRELKIILLQDKLTPEQLEKRLRRKPREEEGDIVDDAIDQAKEMAEVFEGGIYGGMTLKAPYVSIEAKDRKIALRVRPACLLDAMWLQLAQSQSVPNVRKCQQCHSAFIAGGRGRDCRRGDAKFCSEHCRIRFNSLARSRHHA